MGHSIFTQLLSLTKTMTVPPLISTRISLLNLESTRANLGNKRCWLNMGMTTTDSALPMIMIALGVKGQLIPQIQPSFEE